MKTAEELVPPVESAFVRLHGEVQNHQRTLYARTSELEAAERHIAELDGRLLKLKQYHNELKLLKEQTEALLHSPERKIGKLLLTPYRLLEGLTKLVRQKLLRSWNMT